MPFGRRVWCNDGLPKSLTEYVPLAQAASYKAHQIERSQKHAQQPMAVGCQLGWGAAERGQANATHLSIPLYNKEKRPVNHCFRFTGRVFVAPELQEWVDSGVTNAVLSGSRALSKHRLILGWQWFHLCI